MREIPLRWIVHNFNNNNEMFQSRWRDARWGAKIRYAKNTQYAKNA
jgi:hypothetical protein